jgi:uncharacterized membrane protein YagU involved in acid resistance
MSNNFSITSAIKAGIIATAAMTMFTFMAPLMGFEMNIPAMLSGTMGAPIIVGWLAHFMIGTILAISYGAIYLTSTKQIAGIKSGALFSIIPWLMAQIIVMPMMTIMSGGTYGAGFFSGSILIAGASLMGHLLYGVVLGLIYKPVPSADYLSHTNS